MGVTLGHLNWATSLKTMNPISSSNTFIISLIRTKTIVARRLHGSICGLILNSGWGGFRRKQLNKANTTDAEAPFLHLHLSVANEFVSSKIYDKRDDFDFDIIVKFPLLDGDVPRRAYYGVHISQLIRFARVCNHVAVFNARNKCLTDKLLQQGYRYRKLRNTSKFYRRDTTS